MMRRFSRAALSVGLLAFVASGAQGITMGVAHAAEPDLFFVDGEADDPLVGPQHLAFDSVTVSGNAQHVEATASDGVQTFVLQLEPPAGSGLTEGAYTRAQRAGHQLPGAAGLALDSAEHTCMFAYGDFTIDEIDFDGGGAVTSLVVRWVHHCGGDAAADVGAVSFNGSVPLAERSFDTASIDFGSHALGTTSAVSTVTISNAGPAVLHVDSIVATAPVQSAFTVLDDGCSGVPVAAGDTCSFGIVFQPFEPGPATARIAVKDNVAPAGSGFELLVSGLAPEPEQAAFFEGEEDSVLGPMHLSLPLVDVEGTASYVTISGTSGGHTASVTLYAPVGTALAPGVYEGAHRVPTADHGGIDLTTNTSGCNDNTGRFIIDEITYGPHERVVAIAASWATSCGLGKTLGAVVWNTPSAGLADRTIAPSRLAFSTTPATTPSEILVATVSNAGPAPLHIDLVQLTGADAAQFAIVDDPCSGADVAAGASCSISVRFVPDSPGQVNAWLTIFDDIAPDGGQDSGENVLLIANATEPPNFGDFTAITPARVVDTRKGLGAPLAKVGPGGSIDVHVTGAHGVPSSGVSAVVLNVTAANASTAGSYVTLWRTGSAMPGVSNLNPAVGRAVPNMATVRVGTDGMISAFNKLGTVDLIIDVVGYYSDATGPLGSRFHALTPARLADTRYSTGGVGRSPIQPGKELLFDVRGRSGVPQDGVTAVVINVTAINPTSSGFLTVYPADTTRPETSSLNFVAGVTVPNLVTVRVPANGVLAFYNSSGSTHVAIDVVGYYDGIHDGESGRFITVSPQRAWDTRDAAEPLLTGELGVFPIAGWKVPYEATAAVLNVTVVSPTSAGFLTVFPDDLCTLPVVSNLNFSAYQTVPNMVVTRLGTPTGCAVWPGSVDVVSSASAVHVVIDVVGYFT